MAGRYTAGIVASTSRALARRSIKCTAELERSMPEGPEIHRIADRLAAAVLGQPLVHVEFAFRGLKAYERKLRRHEITSITARGKALLTAFDNGWTMYSHNEPYAG